MALSAPHGRACIVPAPHSREFHDDGVRVVRTAILLAEFRGSPEASDLRRRRCLLEQESELHDDEIATTAVAIL